MPEETSESKTRIYDEGRKAPIVVKGTAFETAATLSNAQTDSFVKFEASGRRFEGDVYVKAALVQGLRDYEERELTADEAYNEAEELYGSEPALNEVHRF